MHAGPMPPVALVVEDEGVLRLLIVEELQEAGYMVLEASTGETAVDISHRNIIDLLVTDIELGDGLNGWDVADKLRSMRPQLAVVYASGNSPDNSRRVANAVFFSKPYDAVEVARACQRLTTFN